MTDQLSAEDHVGKREYSSPKLTTYGAVRELTASGTKGNAENKPGQGNPNEKA